MQQMWISYRFANETLQFYFGKGKQTELPVKRALVNSLCILYAVPRSTFVNFGHT